ncbi:MAG: hypothetical protein EHM35_00135 [Planctomycetaceae bacterium]|nr:MAG: hypothetical protein EHM35_00135 [Planctomycetaceae bacterium]
MSQRGGFATLQGQIDQIQKERQRMAGYEGAPDQGAFTASASCPPTTALQLRGGWITGGSGQTFYIQDKTLDFGAGSDDEALAFTNPGWYYGVAVSHSYTYSGTTYEFSTSFNNWWTPERGTAVCAEQYAEWLLRDEGPASSGYLVCIVVLRNDGTVSAPGRVLPIDAVNRGRSYIYRDIRGITVGDWGFWVDSPPPPC